MKAPQFEELALRWQGRASIYYVMSHEAHALAAGEANLGRMLARVRDLDEDNDGNVTKEELEDDPIALGALDIDGDGVVRSPELLAADVSRFERVQEPRTRLERCDNARKLRKELKIRVPMLIDDLDDRTAHAYGRLPNMASVIGKNRRVALSLEWASAIEIEKTLIELTKYHPPAAPEAAAVDLSLLAAHLQRAKERGRPLLVEMVSPGCPACERMKTTTLVDPRVKARLVGYEIARVTIDTDEEWRLFESLGLGGTPAFVRFGPKGRLRGRIEGYQDVDELSRFLSPN